MFYEIKVSRFRHGLLSWAWPVSDVTQSKSQTLHWVDYSQNMYELELVKCNIKFNTKSPVSLEFLSNRTRLELHDQALTRK